MSTPGTSCACPPVPPGGACYGTDWHLVARVNGAERYPERFRTALDATQTMKTRADDFMWRNARSFLNLPGFLKRSGNRLTEVEKRQIDRLLVLLPAAPYWRATSAAWSRAAD